jgi:hypothetical protein
MVITNSEARPPKGTGFNCGVLKKNIEYGSTENNPWLEKR